MRHEFHNGQADGGRDDERGREDLREETFPHEERRRVTPRESPRPESPGEPRTEPTEEPRAESLRPEALPQWPPAWYGIPRPRGNGGGRHENPGGGADDFALIPDASFPTEAGTHGLGVKRRLCGRRMRRGLRWCAAWSAVAMLLTMTVLPPVPDARAGDSAMALGAGQTVLHGDDPASSGNVVHGDDGVIVTAAADGESSTTLPDGVTWKEVRAYIDEHFTGSRVFADAVYDAIRASGQDYTDERLEDQDDLYSAAGVIRLFGVLDPDHTTITVDKPLEDDAVLTGVTLLGNTGSLEIRDVGNHRGLAFIEDAFTPAADGAQPYQTPAGPAIRVSPMNLTVLPKNPYAYNLTKARSGHHTFNTTAYSDLSINVVRDPEGKDARVDIDTTLTVRDGKVEFNLDSGKRRSGNASDAGANAEGDGAEAPVVPEKVGTGISDEEDASSESGKIGAGASEAGRTVRPTEVTPTFQTKSDESDAISTDRVTADGNVVSMSIPSCGTDGSYQERVAFSKLYQHFGGTVQQQFSIDYFYRTSVTYLNTVTIAGEATVLSDLRVRKVDATNDEPLELSQFRLYTDKAATKPARQAVVSLSGEVQYDADGAIAMRDVEPVTTDSDGTLTIEYLVPGDYYLKEIDPTLGYGLPETNPIKVTVKGADEGTPLAGPTLSGGQGNEAKVLKPVNTARADNFKNASNWVTAKNNITLTSELDVARIDDGVYIRNGGKPIAITEPEAATGTENPGDATGGDAETPGDAANPKDAGAGDGADPSGGIGEPVVDANPAAPALTPLGGGSYTVTFGAGESAETKTFATAAEAQDAINAMIKGRKLTCENAAITIDAGTRVYHREAADTDVVTIGDPPLPVHLQVGASKVLKGGDDDIEDGQFRFTLDGADSTGDIHETVGVTSTGSFFANHTGTVDFSPLTFDRAGSYEFTVTEENDPSDTAVSYNPEGVSYRLWVEVVPDWLGRFRMDGVEAEPTESEQESGATDPKDDSTGDADSGGSGSDPDTSQRRYQGLAASVHIAKVTRGADGNPAVGEKEFLGTYYGWWTNTTIRSEDGTVTGFTPNPRFLNTRTEFRFVNVAKSTTLPRTGAAGLLAVSMAGLMLLLAGALIVARESRRNATRR
ncbi:LPXTG cell wall anchor domain-containing protein [Bifidobacterium sp. MA2]|uniref:LPXTG cell wall anchor domain-containing protein n=1 Tax=Bifidobacterium santillanense TaxID=2809028 RepID=A0ABS5UQF9_9BIFI|nr:SpaA isopeptide-forming pilin-related protein [Bifidobacterium santillanense]MBT1173132.1 LPXTG cell wall anchor domain-containing protein [Bifidobacterium santillanense]